ncbi:unnamed protein product [Ectocarpus sp. CCAP 1310/34]|nr:unnamed protein product [Ectocarpus sp. CCAP 1310/34]
MIYISRYVGASRVARCWGGMCARIFTRMNIRRSPKESARELVKPITTR